MELLENKRVASRYSESIRSLHKHSPIELGKKITSPKKRKSKKNPPLKVIKIRNNVIKPPLLPKYSPMNNMRNENSNGIPNTNKYRYRRDNNYNHNNHSGRHPRFNNKITKTPMPERKPIIPPPYSRKNLTITRDTSPSYPSNYDNTYKDTSPSNKFNRFENSPPHKNYYPVNRGPTNVQFTNSIPTTHTSNINYQYIPQIQNKYREEGENRVETPYKPIVKSQNKIIKKKMPPGNRNQNVYTKRNVYI